jgi:DNA-binding winged helix-turn-helix (wHTH) protein
VESAGRVVTKDQLMQSIWPHTVVEENNLTQNIYTLRKLSAIADHPIHRSIDLVLRT